MSMQIARKVVNHFQKIKKPQSDMEQLTKREHEILALLAKGYLYKEIADQLGITLSTVRAHLHAVYEKLHVQSRTEAVVKFLERDKNVCTIADALVDVIFVGKGQTSSGTRAATGTLTFNDGTLDVNTLEAGYQNSAAAAAVVTGTVNVKNTAQLLVNSTLRLARYTGGGTLPAGTLNIFGGTVAGDGDIVAGGGTSTIAIINGVLAVTGVVGTPAAPIGKVALTNATLQFSVDTVTTRSEEHTSELQSRQYLV